MFGEVAPGGIKFHRQGAKFKQQRRGRIPPEGLALHAFCRFVRPASASAALQQGEIFILGQSVQINPAFMRGALPAEMSGGVGMPPRPPRPHEQRQGGGDWGSPPAPGGTQGGGRVDPVFAPPDAVPTERVRMLGIGGDGAGDGGPRATTSPVLSRREMSLPLGVDGGGGGDGGGGVASAESGRLSNPQSEGSEQSLTRPPECGGDAPRALAPSTCSNPSLRCGSE